MLVFSMTENISILLLFHGLQGFALSLAQILVEDELVLREWWRDIGFIPQEAGDAEPPVGIRGAAAVADTRVHRVCFMA